MPAHRKFTDEQFIEAVRTSKTAAETMNKLGFNGHKSLYTAFHKYKKILNVDCSHFVGSGYLKGTKREYIPTKTLEEITTENSTYRSNKLKQRLIRDNIFENKCHECGQPPTWRGKPLVLEIHHINGISNDNRLCNLTILCPNCHTQTPNHRNKSRFPEENK